MPHHAHDACRGGCRRAAHAPRCPLSWLAEILRKQHRACAECGLGPTHLYDADPASPRQSDGAPDEPAGVSGISLCNSCLGGRLARDLSSFTGRCLLFEPSLGPEAFIFRHLPEEADGSNPPDQVAAARSWLDRLAGRCASCNEAGRYLWVPVEHDANMWADDWLARLADGTLAPSDNLCGACAAGRLVASMEERGLHFEAIVAPCGTSPGADGMMFGSEL